MKIKVIAIDMIGVIINETRIISNRLYNMVENNPISKEKMKDNYDNGISSGQLTIEEFWAELAIENWETYEYNFLSSLDFNNDCKTFFEKYKESVKFVLVSDLPTKWSKIILNENAIYKYFDELICGDTKDGSKKDGSSYKLLAKNHGIEGTLVIDDTLKHLQRAADMKFNVVHFISKKDKDSPFTTIDNFSDLGNYLSSNIE